MTSLSIYTKLESLPPQLKKEAISFIDSLLKKSNKKDANKKRVPVFGYAKGKIHLSDDFDEPLEEFKDYI
jgi:hypothetical protein